MLEVSYSSLIKIIILAGISTPKAFLEVTNKQLLSWNKPRVSLTCTFYSSHSFCATHTPIVHNPYGISYFFPPADAKASANIQSLCVCWSAPRGPSCHQLASALSALMALLLQPTGIELQTHTIPGYLIFLHNMKSTCQFSPCFYTLLADSNVSCLAEPHPKLTKQSPSLYLQLGVPSLVWQIRPGSSAPFITPQGGDNMTVSLKPPSGGLDPLCVSLGPTPGTEVGHRRFSSVSHVCSSAHAQMDV